MALSDVVVRRARITGKPYSIPDQDGLAIHVSASGCKSWHFRYYWLGRQKRMSFGTYPELSLKEARALRDEARALVASGTNPHVERKQQRLSARLPPRSPGGFVQCILIIPTVPACL